QDLGRPTAELPCRTVLLSGCCRNARSVADMLGLGLAGKQGHEGGSSAGRVLAADRGAVKFRDPSADRKAQSRALDLSANQPLERLEDDVPVFGRDPRTVVGDGEEKAVGRALHRDRNK